MKALRQTRLFIIHLSANKRNGSYFISFLTYTLVNILLQLRSVAQWLMMQGSSVGVLKADICHMTSKMIRYVISGNAVHVLKLGTATNTEGNQYGLSTQRYFNSLFNVTIKKIFHAYKYSTVNYSKY